MSVAPIGIAGLNAVIQHNLGPEPGETPTGEFFVDSRGDRHMVFAESHEVTEVREVRDSAGTVRYHLNADHTRGKPMTERVVVEVVTREYIKLPLGNGVVQRHYNFRPSKEELDARRQREEEANAVTELTKFLREQGKGFGDLLNGLKGAASKGGKAKAEAGE